ncbi:non-canonical purine NTP pyrophosphatase [Corynebacterium ulceribovis]|uniref:non-canonical purine NTP pyrophosphatase n=1 Tax=Corynebacterium ulceribovis TaxID=487732 RepID=UPI000375EB5A|nr:non-canonical purine NTP pyrophosphatase [Corynebacterium ulceribovis]
MQLLLASNNPKKAKELHRVLAAAHITGVELLTLKDVPAYNEPVENGRTFEDNALIKARAGAANSGLPCLADDSGLAVDELNGMPGVLSARWSGGDDQANNDLLLHQLAHAPAERRGAKFVSVCALVVPGGAEGATGAAGAAEYVVRGEWPGTIAFTETGDNGFGYDPLFLPQEQEDPKNPVSSAELTPDQKDALSHRGRALAQLVPVLQQLLG